MHFGRLFADGALAVTVRCEEDFALVERTLRSFCVDNKENDLNGPEASDGLEN